MMEVETLRTEPCGWMHKPCILGIDEAGRGSDSKTLLARERDKLFRLVENDNRLTAIRAVLSAEYLSKKMLSRAKTSLNILSFDAAVSLVNEAISIGYNITEVYCDTVGDPTKYTKFLSDRFPGVNCTAAVKADSIYPVVSAASIVAKVSRDSLLAKWTIRERREFSREYGSGYPSDPITKIWLKQSVDPVFGFPAIARFSWQTSKTLLEKEAAKADWENDAEESESFCGKRNQAADYHQTSLTFFAVGSSSRNIIPHDSSGRKRCKFFGVRKLLKTLEF